MIIELLKRGFACDEYAVNVGVSREALEEMKAKASRL